MSNLLHVSSSPHVRSQSSTTTIMADVVIALIPATAWGVYRNGWHAFWLVMACILTSVATEYVYQKLMKKPVTIHDLSAMVTGILLALNLPQTFPIWMAVVGSVFAVLVVKQVFGGIGQNFMNPALAARCFLLISFGSQMTNYAVDTISGATPLALIKNGAADASVQTILAGDKLTLTDLFVGNIDGCIGEVSTLMILIGAAYLLIRKVISWRTPVMYLLTFTVFMGLFAGRGFDMTYLAAELCTGGIMLGAFFMATDYTTSPITPNGKLVYGIVLGLVTGIFRIWSGSAEGVSYAIIFCNLLVPLIEKVTVPTAFGKGRVKNVSK
ncbi:MAG: RnfABCDGE type electron transport complex subunit D [bacterium]|nr:RnfABCDGE type electron transport complex subunit D [bacterium]